MPMRIHTWNAQRCDARGVGPAMLVPETLSQRCLMPEALSQRCLIPEALSQRCLMPEALSQRCLMPFLAMPDPEVLPMQRSLPSVGSLAHTTSRTTRTENPARCRLLDARLHNYTTPNTTRRPTQHDAQHNTTPNTPRSTERNTRSATHVCRQPRDSPSHARPPVHTSTATISAYDGPISPHTASPNDHC
jgi:hypothetical protein